MGTDRSVPKKGPRWPSSLSLEQGTKGFCVGHCWSGCVRLWGTRNFSRVWAQAEGTGYRAPGAEAYRVPRAQRDPRDPSLLPGAGYATAHLLDGRHGVPALGRARGEARGRGRLVVLKGLGHEFRHGDLVRHRQGAGARTAAASVAQGAGSDPAAARGLEQREARERKSPRGAGATAAGPVAAGAHAARSSVRCAPGAAATESSAKEPRRGRAQSRGTARHQATVRDASRGKGRARLGRRRGPPGGAGRRPGRQSGRPPLPRRQEAEASARRAMCDQGLSVAVGCCITSAFRTCLGSRARPVLDCGARLPPRTRHDL